MCPASIHPGTGNLGRGCLDGDADGEAIVGSTEDVTGVVWWPAGGGGELGLVGSGALHRSTAHEAVLRIGPQGNRAQESVAGKRQGWDRQALYTMWLAALATLTTAPSHRRV